MSSIYSNCRVKGNMREVAIRNRVVEWFKGHCLC
jgi:hypothetical protein